MAKDPNESVELTSEELDTIQGGGFMPNLGDALKGAAQGAVTGGVLSPVGQVVKAVGDVASGQKPS